MNLQEAGDAPRVVHTGSSEPTGERMVGSGRVLVEHGFPPESLRELMRRGHAVGHGLEAFGGYQAVAREDGVLYGASEARKDGQAAGR
jgi:gamma-glutamyltranspeptidase/glutathione hydrolase